MTLSRFETHYVVTEYGIAQLRGKTLRQRAQALIAIAHPSFRDQLKEAYRAEIQRALSLLTEKAPFPCNFGKGAFLSAPPFQLRL